MSDISRRGFLKSAAGAATAFGIPLFIPASALGRDGRPAPSERIAMGTIGTGGMGTGDLKIFLGISEVQMSAVCDVNRERRLKARSIVEEYYAKEAPSGSWKGCGDYNDFRELLARDDIDAIIIGTPDHWHALISIAAAEAGKDIYCEKPLSHSVAEGRAVADAVQRTGRVFQTGSQLRSRQIVRFACELVRNGRIGRLRTIRTGCGEGAVSLSPPRMIVPDGFDYDMWLGPAPWAPYTADRCLNWRSLFDYAGGRITDIGAHDNDVAQWGNGTERTGPVEIEGWGEFPRDGLWNTAVRYRIEFSYANGVKLVCSHEPLKGVTFEGDEGWIASRDELSAEPANILHQSLGASDVRLYKSDNHHQNFLDCIRSRGETVAPPEIAHRSATICHLGNIAIRLGRKLRWDPDKERFKNDPEADGMLSRPMRAPWRI